MLFTAMWPLAVLYALAAQAAVVPGGRRSGPKVDKRGPNDALYLQQARDAESTRNPGWTAMGCRTDSPTRSLDGMYLSWSNMTLPICMNECFTRGYSYGGVQFGVECWCGSTIKTGTYFNLFPPDQYIKNGDPYGTLVPYSECQNFPCSGDKSTNCGGHWRNNVFMVADRAQASANIKSSADAVAYSTSAAAYSTRAAAFSTSANAYSSSTSAAAYSSNAAAFSRSASAYSSNAAAYSTSANYYSSSTDAANRASASTYSSNANAYSASVNASQSAAASRSYAASVSAYSSNAAAYSASASTFSSNAAAYSASASGYSVRSSAAAYSANAAAFSANASAYSANANAYSTSSSAAAYASNAAAYSASVNAAAAAASASTYSSNAAAYSASASAYSANANAYSASSSAAAYSANANAYSASSNAAAYSASVNNAAAASASAYSSNAAAYSASVNGAAAASASAYSSNAAAYSASVNNAAQASAAAYSGSVYSASVAAYSQSASAAAAASASAAAASASAAADAAKLAETLIPDTWAVPRTICVAEGTTGRAMTGASISSPGMSAGRCIKYCNDAGFVLAGTQYSTECTCSNILNNGASLDKPSNYCNMKCGGSDQICGGPNAITLYVKQSAMNDLSSDYTEKPIVMVDGWQVASSDCIAEGTSGRALPDASFADPNMTPAKCMSFCGSKQFQYAGVEYGTECYCSGSLQNGASLDKKAQCSMTCGGNPSIICGGPGALNLFVNPSIGNGLTQAAASSASAASAAQNSNAAALQAKLPSGWAASSTPCLHEVQGRALTGASTAGDDMTVDKCVNYCASKGFTLAGLEYGGECYCANSLSNGASLDKTNDQCNMKCSGDSTQICGGPDSITLFSGPAAAPSTAASSTAASSTAASSVAASTAASPSAAASPAASPTATSSVAASSAASSAAPSAVPSGPQPATNLPSGWSAASTNCIQEVSGRALTGYSEIANDMTIPKCISICGNRGFKLAAVEYGAECYCGNSLANGASLDLVSGQCYMGCAGDSMTLCGGPNALQLYSNPNAVAVSTAAPSATASAAPAGPTAETNLPSGWQAASTPCLQEVQGRALTGYAETTDDMTIGKCLGICESKGFFYAAVEYGGECHCGNGFSNGASLDNASQQCNMGCNGKKSTLCGGPDALQLYTNPSLDPSLRGHNGFSYSGCIMEVPGRALNATSLVADDMTVDKCVGFCQSGGYKMAGLEFGSECYCGNSLAGGASTSSMSYECKRPCSGDSTQICGGPDAINLYISK